MGMCNRKVWRPDEAAQWSVSCACICKVIAYPCSQGALSLPLGPVGTRQKHECPLPPSPPSYSPSWPDPYSPSYISLLKGGRLGHQNQAQTWLTLQAFWFILRTWTAVAHVRVYFFVRRGALQPLLHVVRLYFLPFLDFACCSLVECMFYWQLLYWLCCRIGTVILIKVNLMKRQPNTTCATKVLDKFLYHLIK